MTPKPTFLRLDNQNRRVYQAEFIVDSTPRNVRLPMGGASGNVAPQGSLPPCGAHTGHQYQGHQDNAAGGDTDGSTDTNANIVRDPWRLISAVQAWPTTGHWLPQLVDYGHDGGKALKQAIPIINSTKPDLTWNHSMDVRDVAGHIENARWEDSKDIPPGINADLVVDPEFDRKAAVGLSKGAIRNGSIGINMEIRQSHEDMDTEKFMELQGEEVGGDICRWLVVATTGVRHMAMVAAGTGADPNSGKRGDNSHNENAHSNNTGHSDNTSSGDDDMDEKLKALLLSFGAEFTKPGETNLSAEEILKRLPERLEMAKVGDLYLKELAADALKWFDAAKVSQDKPGLNEDERELREIIASCRDARQLRAYVIEYQSQAKLRFGPVMSNRSSAAEEIPTPTAGGVGNLTGFDRDLAESVKKLFPEGAKP